MSDTAGMPSSPLDLDAALAAARAGDETAFVVVFRAVQPRLLSYLRARTGPDAEDVAADTWARVVAGLRDFTGDAAAFRRWVFTIAHARAVDSWRSHGRRLEDPTDALPDAAANVDVAHEAETRTSTAAAVELPRRLPEVQAQVLMLRVLAGLDVAGTAAVLGRSPNHVRVLAHRGLRALQSMVEEPSPA